MPNLQQWVAYACVQKGDGELQNSQGHRVAAGACLSSAAQVEQTQQAADMTVLHSDAGEHHLTPDTRDMAEPSSA